jgi:hypothetical protein
MLHKGNDEHLPLQSNIICLLLFFVSVLLITQHPALVWVAAAAFVDPSTASISDMVGSKTFVYPDQHARLLRPWRIGLAVPCD